MDHMPPYAPEFQAQNKTFYRGSFSQPMPMWCGWIGKPDFKLHFKESHTLHIFLQCWNDPILTKPASQNKDFDVNIIRFQTTKLQIIWQINFRYKYLPRKGCNDLIEEKHTRMTKLVRDQCLCISTSPSPTTATKQDAKVWWYQLKLIIIIVMAREVFFSTSLLKVV